MTAKLPPNVEIPVVAGIAMDIVRFKLDGRHWIDCSIEANGTLQLHGSRSITVRPCAGNAISVDVERLP